MEARETWDFDTDVIPGYFMWDRYNMTSAYALIKRFMEAELLASTLFEEMQYGSSNSTRI